MLVLVNILYDEVMSTEIDDDGEMRDRLIEFSIMYELFCVPDARILTCRWRTICTLRFRTFWCVDGSVAVLRPAYAVVYIFMYVAGSFWLVSSLILIRGLLIAVKEWF